MGRNLLARQVATNGWKLSWISHSSSVVRYRSGFEYLYLDEEVYLRVRVGRIKICEHIMSRHQRVATGNCQGSSSSSRSSVRNGLCRCRCRKKGLPEWIHIQILSVRTFFPSSSCVPCANTLSTLFGSPNVMKPKPLQVEKEKETNAHYENHVIKAHSL